MIEPRDLERESLEAFAKARDGRCTLLGRAIVASLALASSRSNARLQACRQLEAVSNVTVAWRSDTSGQCASHNTPISTKSTSYPTVGLTGLLRLVKTIAKIKAHPPSREEEVPSCPSAMSPPACQSSCQEPVADFAGAQTATTNQHSQSDAGKSAERLLRAGGNQ